MSKLFSDGMDVYSLSSQLSQRYDVITGSPIFGATVGRFSEGGITIDGTSGITKNIDGDPQTCVVSFAVFRENTDPEINLKAMLRIGNAASAVGILDWIYLDTSDVIQVRRDTTSLGTFTITRNVWHWVSMKVKAANSGGTIDIEVDGVSVFTFSGDTVNTGNEDCTRVQLLGNADQDAIYDDFIITDVAGGAPFNDVLAGKRISTLLPSAAGDSTEYTGNPSANFTNAQTNDSDTSTNVNATATEKDLYQMGNMGFPPTEINAVDVIICAKNPDPGSFDIKSKTKTGTTESSGSTKTLTSSYQYFQETLLVDPDTSSAWTLSGVNDMQAGMETV